MSKIKVSIIVPCYKVERYLSKCLDGLMQQTLREIEVICINDGSPDNCLKIMQDYKRQYGDKIIIVNKKNGGLWNGRQDGIKKARGEFISFVDSDDYVRNDFVEKLYNAAVKNNAEIAVCGFDRVDMDTGKVYSREMCKFKSKNVLVAEDPGLLLEMNPAVWNKIYKAEILKNMPKMKNTPNVMEDLRLVQLALINTQKVTFVSESLYSYMVRRDSMINNIDKKSLPIIQAALREVREIYQKKRPENLDFIDASAFLHIGVSLMYRLSADKNNNLSKEIKSTTKLLNEYFPNWRTNKYLKLNYIIKHNFVNIKSWGALKCYNMNLLPQFLRFYNLMINKLKVDIKW